MCIIPRFYTHAVWGSYVLMIKEFAYIVIADITAGQINHYFAEIAPRTVYPLYGIQLTVKCGVGSLVDFK